MGLFGKKTATARPEDIGAQATEEAVAAETTPADYDAQSDLGLPTAADAEVPDEGFVPFTGVLAPEAPAAAYDAERDVGF